MSRVSLFNSPLLLGFDHFERVLDRVSKTPTEGYPPYNIEQTGETGLRISIAVAGFSEKDLSVTIEDNQLVVRGKHTEDGQKVYLHRGIATRQFQRSFVLAEGIEVKEAAFDNGLLHIDLLRPSFQPRIKNIKIQTTNRTGNLIKAQRPYMKSTSSFETEAPSESERELYQGGAGRSSSIGQMSATAGEGGNR